MIPPTRAGPLSERGTEPAGRVRMPRRAFEAGLVVLTLVVVGYFALPMVSQAESAVSLMTSVRPLYLVLGLSLEVASLLAYSALTWTVLPPAARPAYTVVLRADLTGLGVSHVLPGGGATSTALRFRLLTAAGVGRSSVISATAIESAGMAVVLALVFVLGVALALSTARNSPYLLVAGVLAAVLLLASALAVVVVLRHEDAVAATARSVARRVRVVTPEAAETVVRTLAARLAALGADRGLLARVVGWATANWLLDAASLWVFLRAFGETEGVRGLLLGYGLAGVLALLPLTPGGLGLVEAALVSVLVAFGATHAHALLGVLSWRVAEFWLPIPASALAYLSLRTGALRRHRLSPGPFSRRSSGPTTARRTPPRSRRRVP